MLLRLRLLFSLLTTKMGETVPRGILILWGISWVPNIRLSSPTVITAPPPSDQDQISLSQW